MRKKGKRSRKESLSVQENQGGVRAKIFSRKYSVLSKKSQGRDKVSKGDKKKKCKRAPLGAGEAKRERRRKGAPYASLGLGEARKEKNLGSFPFNSREANEMKKMKQTFRSAIEKVRETQEQKGSTS